MLNNQSFNNFKLQDFLMQAIEKLGFTNPTQVQEQAIPLLINGHDVIAQAQTGTGKTAAFALPILNFLNTSSCQTQALILAPTRELAIQIGEQFSQFGQHNRKINIAILCGGQDYRQQLKALKDGAQIVVGTPGRILDHIERRSLNLSNLKTFILDEADEMLRMGFIEDVENILSMLPSTKQMALFSATMPNRIRQIANQYLKNPQTVTIQSSTATVKTIQQEFAFAAQSQKNNALYRILAGNFNKGVIVFVKTKLGSEDVSSYLKQNGINSVAIHGDLSQALREKIIVQFKEGTIAVLVATDVAARGLDVEHLSLVINYDMPQDCETYVHRIGRTGRAGRSGRSILFVTPKETRMLQMIERHTKQRIEKINLPSDLEIQQLKEQNLLTQIVQRIEHHNIKSYKLILEKYLKQNPEIDILDLAAATMLMQQNDKPLLEKLPQISAHQDRSEKSRRSNNFKNDSPRIRERGNDRGSRSNNMHSGINSKMMSYRIDVGRLHGVRPGNIVGAIANEGGIPSKLINGLQIHEDYSTVNLPENLSKETCLQIGKAWVCGRQLKLSLIKKV